MEACKECVLVNFLTGYLVILNCIGLFVMWSDKQRARKGAWRISEKTLFFVALLGGALGTTLGMYWFRHKTRHWYFKYGFPAILLAEALLVCQLVL